MATKFLSLACINGNDSSRAARGALSPRPHYPSMPKYPKGAAPEEITAERAEAKALFGVVGMSCAACAGSVEKAIKRLPGIREAVVDVLNGRAQVIFFPDFVNVILNSLFHFF